jgi:hypothetical protein
VCSSGVPTYPTSCWLAASAVVGTSIRAAFRGRSSENRSSPSGRGAVLATIGAVAGLVCARLMLPGLVRLAGDNVPRLADAHVSSKTLGFSVAVAFLAVIGTGLIPALRHSRTDLQSALQQAASGRQGPALIPVCSV